MRGREIALVAALAVVRSDRIGWSLCALARFSRSCLETLGGVVMT